MSEPSGEAPRAFISYAWSDAEHTAKVLGLAERLTADGVHITIDKWDLQTGHDAYAFMERIVTDPSLDKIIIVSNKIYTEKANNRKGGTGAEAQIISPEIYKEVDQGKFGLVAFELSDDGKPYVPAFYGSRLYVNLATDIGYEEEYDQLLRWLYGRPLHRRPSIGKMPQHLAVEDQGAPQTKSTFLRALDSVRQGRGNAAAMMRAYRDAVEAELSRHALVSGGANDFDDRVLESVKALRPVMNELQDLTIETCRSQEGTALFPEIIDLLERVQVFAFRPPDVNQWHEWDFDNFRFFAHEGFLSVAAIVLRERKFDLLGMMLSHRYVNPRSRNGVEFSNDFSAFDHWLKSMQHRNQRLGLNRYSVYADELSAHYQGTALGIEDVAAADLLLFLADARLALARDSHQPSWHPLTLLFVEDRSRPLEIFARAESQRFANSLAGAIGLPDYQQLKHLIDTVAEKGWSPKVGIFGTSIGVLANVERMGLFP